ncbi:geranylgeranylglycerol-phosphate geranylgeranyltransferase [Halobacteriales archaeon QS_4_69_34]|nr:MAG: geranylgeranylglycerol-phosphate geranylgeranyltransferase [Halobacteriales archaeon QS_4_69_34]
MPAGERARGLLELTRPANAVAAGVLTLIGAFVAGVDASAIVRTGAAVGATVLAVGAGNTINDYFDREIDAINRPDRAIPRGAVTPRAALAFSLVLFAGAVGLALLLPLAALAIAGVNLLALVAYTELFKGLPGVGNVVVGYLGGSTFLFGGAAVGEIDSGVLVLFVLAALSTVAREIVKDVEDVAGDRQEGLRTLPIVLGERRALLIAAGVLAIALFASPAPYLQSTFGWPYLLVVAFADGAMIYAAAESFADPTAGQEHLSYAMFLAGLAFVVGRIAVLV